MAKSISTDETTGKKSVIDEMTQETGKVIDKAFTVDWGEAEKDHSKFDWGAAIADYTKNSGR